ncbi:kiSS-1 receptor-like [Schistocerca serialis cubense]|uniref:kiSS-1 receptor-like n=1 Tax=Schistocerca serialis cubense TaxID=2023355 RepID=UPI00214E0376|nr:kiSS-1 receptor-like [Schistocerca serialis cubense]
MTECRRSAMGARAFLAGRLVAVLTAAVAGALSGAEAAEPLPEAAPGLDGSNGSNGSGGGSAGGGGARPAEDYEMYDYSWSESHAIFNWSELAPALLVYGATFALGVAGNSLIIFTVCRYRRMSTTTNVFLASLASADLLLITVCIPVKIYIYMI